MNASATKQPALQAPACPPAAKAIATGLGLGYLPIAPGTWGSLGGIVLYFAIEPLAKVAGLSFMVTSIVVNLLVAIAGVWAATAMARHLCAKDPGAIVVDEVSGQLIACFAFAPLGWKWLVAAFFLFRAFDIWKPFPARQAESLPEGLGIMADDWIAGAYAAFVLTAARWFFA